MAGPKYKQEGKDSSGEYDTFDSAGGPIQADAEKDMDHCDANPSDNGVVHGAVPEVPQR